MNFSFENCYAYAATIFLADCSCYNDIYEDIVFIFYSHNLTNFMRSFYFYYS